MTNEANMLLKTKDRAYKRSQTNPISRWEDLAGIWGYFWPPDGQTAGPREPICAALNHPLTPQGEGRRWKLETRNSEDPLTRPPASGTLSPRRGLCEGRRPAFPKGPGGELVRPSGMLTWILPWTAATTTGAIRQCSRRIQRAAEKGNRGVIRSPSIVILSEAKNLGI